ncbi:MAG: transcriptional regulator [Nitrospirae bacterium]|nr:transcriptional regulator [Nitrospirota bacterium]
MSKRPKKPHIPADRRETIRQGITAALKGNTLSAKELSGALRVSEKEIYEHLSHIQKTVHKSDYVMVITPAECRKCGFVFEKREKLQKPGRCPICRSESIEEPLFGIASKTADSH